MFTDTAPPPVLQKALFTKITHSLALPNSKFSESRDLAFPGHHQYTSTESDPGQALNVNVEWKNLYLTALERTLI